jgi:hypothetical protein
MVFFYNSDLTCSSCLHPPSFESWQPRQCSTDASCNCLNKRSDALCCGGEIGSMTSVEHFFESPEGIRKCGMYPLPQEGVSERTPRSEREKYRSCQEACKPDTSYSASRTDCYDANYAEASNCELERFCAWVWCLCPYEWMRMACV